MVLPIWKCKRASTNDLKGEVARTNRAERFLSRLSWAELSTHHHISGQYLNTYSDEMAWRDDNRRESNGNQLLMIPPRRWPIKSAASGKGIGCGSPAKRLIPRCFRTLLLSSGNPWMISLLSEKVCLTLQSTTAHPPSRNAPLL